MTQTAGHYRKKVSVHAEPYRPGLEDGYRLAPSVVGDWYRPPPTPGQRGKSAYAAYIDTFEGEMFIGRGDWIITSSCGDRYPINGEVFAATYERVPDDE